jgi:alpha-galactosidase
LETGRVYRGHFNVVNNGCITNLPDDCIVEVPGYADTHGVNIPRLGDLPLGCAAACLSNITVQRLAVEAAAHADVMLLRQAMMMDPLVGAVLDTRAICQMTDEMLIAQAEWLPQYAPYIQSAKARWTLAEREGTLIPPIVTRGAARLATKTVEELAKDKVSARSNAAEADKAKDRPAR